MGLSGAPFSNQLLLAVSLPVLPRIVGETGSGDAFVPGVIGDIRPDRSATRGAARGRGG